MEDLRLNLIFNNYIKTNWEANEIKINNDLYLISSKLKGILRLRMILSFIIIGLVIFLSKFILEPVLSPIITRTGALLVFLFLTVFLIYALSYFLIPKDLAGEVEAIGKKKS